MPENETVSESELEKLVADAEKARKADAKAQAKEREEIAARTRAVKAERLKRELGTLDGSSVAPSAPAPSPSPRKSKSSSAPDDTDNS